MMGREEDIKKDGKALVFSDSHGMNGGMRKVLLMHPDVDTVIHLGDGCADLTLGFDNETEFNIIAIEGNGEYYGFSRVDRRFMPKRKMLLDICGTKLYMMHGHTADVKFGIKKAAAEAYAAGADVLLYGHTHIPICKYLPVGTELPDIGETERPLLLFNPGSVGKGYPPSFGVLSWKGGVLLPSHGKL